MDQSPRLALPYLLPNQAQKHVTHNEAIRRLDALVQMRVLSSVLAAEPAGPEEGDAYLLPAAPSGAAWGAAAAGQVAVFQDGAWTFLTPAAGWCLFDAGRGLPMLHDGTGWSDLADRPQAHLGINTTADDTNRLAVKAEAELLSHDDVSPGSGDARKVINKAAASNTASVVFQTGFAGRAEIGLAGDDDLRLRVYDGAEWRDGVAIDRTSGQARFPGGLAHALTGAAMRSLVPVSGGDGVVSAFRINTARSQGPRTYTIAAIAGDMITLSAASTAEIFEDSFMAGVSLLRVWNLSRSPEEPAWVKSAPTGTDLQVSDAADLSGWSAGDTLQVGDPASVMPYRGLTLDISPMIQVLFGTVFPQAGLLLKVACGGSGGANAMLETTPDGSLGSFLGQRSLSDGTVEAGQLTLATPVASPVSDSNLLILREQDLGGLIGTSIVSVAGIWV